MPIGAPPPSVQDLTRVQDRSAFLYLERCRVHRDGNALTARDERGTVYVPAASLAALLLGPGATVTHQAMVLLAESGATAVWVGENGVRYYAHGRPLARSSRLLEAQARVASNRLERIACARAMYAMRFPDDDCSRLTMQQLRGREGARVRRCYREESQRTGVPWSKRDYRPDDFSASDPINQALSAAHTALYGLVHAVIVALGCSPGLGIVHTGHDRSFVYDIADLYKAETSIPVAFDVASEGSVDVPSATRRAMRDTMFRANIIERCVSDIRTLLGIASDDSTEMADVIALWDPSGVAVAGGANYSDDPWADE